MASKLHAWATPAFVEGSPVDHTWVTTYDNHQHPYPDAQAVVAAGEAYWFCWGDFHPKGGIPGNPTGGLGYKAGNLAVAKCLVLPNADLRNVPAAQGTIFTYGVDGVCHQLANQVLFATTTPSSAPLTVSAARGYWASTLIYGTYGLQHSAWSTKKAVCAGLALPGAGPASRAKAARQGDTMPDPVDDFAARAHAVLGKSHPKKLADLLALRADTHRFAAQRWPGSSPPGADALNARNQHLVDQAAALLGPEHFRAIFGFEAGEKITLVDPRMTPRTSSAPTPSGGAKRPSSKRGKKG